MYVYMFICLEEGRYQYGGICDASNIIKYGRRTQELSNAPLHMKQDTNSIEQ